MDDMIKNAIDWNKKEFYRALNQNRLSDAARYKDNIERMLKDEEPAREGS